MIEYQNIFTQVQVRGPVEMGVDNENNMAAERGGTPWFSRLAGWIGNAQIGPVFLGWTGIIALSANAPWPISLLPGVLIGLVSPTEKGGKL